MSTLPIVGPRRQSTAPAVPPRHQPLICGIDRPCSTCQPAQDAADRAWRRRDQAARDRDRRRRILELLAELIDVPTEDLIDMLLAVSRWAGRAKR